MWELSFFKLRLMTCRLNVNGLLWLITLAIGAYGKPAAADTANCSADRKISVVSHQWEMKPDDFSYNGVTTLSVIEGEFSESSSNGEVSHSGKQVLEELAKRGAYVTDQYSYSWPRGSTEITKKSLSSTHVDGAGNPLPGDWFKLDLRDDIRGCYVESVASNPSMPPTQTSAASNLDSRFITYPAFDPHWDYQYLGCRTPQFKPKVRRGMSWTVAEIKQGNVLQDYRKEVTDFKQCVDARFAAERSTAGRNENSAQAHARALQVYSELAAHVSQVESDFNMQLRIASAMNSVSRSDGPRGQVATHCVALVAHSGITSNAIRNNCDATINVEWCTVGVDCKSGGVSLTTVGPQEEQPIVTRPGGIVHFAACTAPAKAWASETDPYWVDTKFVCKE